MKHKLYWLEKWKQGMCFRKITPTLDDTCSNCKLCAYEHNYNLICNEEYNDIINHDE